MSKLTISTVMADQERIGDCYPEFLESLENCFRSTVGQNTKLFTTNCGELFDLFLDNLPTEARQHYTCTACRRFVNNYGGLVTISDVGEIASVLWDEKNTPQFFVAAVKTMKTIVLKSKVTGVFISGDVVLGYPVTGKWQHMSALLPSTLVYHSKLKTANQLMAEKREDFRILITGLLEYPIEAVEQALILLKTESLYRSEKCLGVAEWLRGLHISRSNTKNSRIRDNLAWLAVGTAPTGYCHVKSSMIGTLLDDIITELPFSEVSRKFAEKMNPLHYQRPQAAPTAGNIKQAEAIVEKLGIQKSLVRRFARLEELNTVWKPKVRSEKLRGTGMFAHLEAKNQKEKPKQMEIPAITITWEKFARTVLPLAENIEFLIKDIDNFSAILTAAHKDAPPILQWDSLERRNPFSHYVYNGGSPYTRWGLSRGYCDVTGICFQPSEWYGNFSNQGKSVSFILEGAKDSSYKTCGNALFPETLKSELREIRSTIESFSKNAIIEGYEEASACGIRLQSGEKLDATFRVTTSTGTAIYKLDRWD